jgi:hypothetical protein
VQPAGAARPKSPMPERPSWRGSRAGPKGMAERDYSSAMRAFLKAAQPMQPWFDVISHAFPQFQRPTVVTFASFADQDFHELLQIDETILVQIIGLELTEWDSSNSKPEILPSLL